MVKTCNGCKDTKVITEFYKKARYNKYQSLAGYSSRCKSCDRLERARYVKNNPSKCKDTDRAHHLWTNYKMEVWDYNKLFDEQKGCCLGCNRHQSEFTRALVVDHCHETGKIRGLLCVTCNLAIGHVKDDIKILYNLIDYLIKNRTESAATQTGVDQEIGLRKRISISQTEIT